jgi:hypothetical protein
LALNASGRHQFSPVDYAKLRWRIEYDYKELKQEVGLGDFEARGWRGFHHHATMSIVVLIPNLREGSLFPPMRVSWQPTPCRCPAPTELGI